MPNLATALREEIIRLARKEVKVQTADLKRSSVRYRRDIAQLKRENEELKKALSFLEKQEKKRVTKQPSTELAKGTRFSAAGLKSTRSKLGLSQGDFGKLVGVTALSIYNWESGNVRPREKYLAALVEVRKLGKREAMKRLEMLD
mgnify:CR=1 FL=1|jgi:DNA-binding transcriptional regulator YiaG